MLGRGPVTRVVIPPLVPTNAFSGTPGLRRLAVVAGIPGERSSDDCVEELGNDPYTDLSGCLLAIHVFNLGPVQRLQGGLGLTLLTGDVGQDLHIIVTLTGSGGWQTWDTFDFIVEDE